MVNKYRISEESVTKKKKSKIRASFKGVVRVDLNEKEVTERRHGSGEEGGHASLSGESTHLLGSSHAKAGPLVPPVSFWKCCKAALPLHSQCQHTNSKIS